MQIVGVVQDRLPITIIAPAVEIVLGWYGNFTECFPVNGIVELYGADRLREKREDPERVQARWQMVNQSITRIPRSARRVFPGHTAIPGGNRPVAGAGSGFRQIREIIHQRCPFGLHRPDDI